ncbi:hypothetical protein PENSPDRAFT_734927 [Peniophora sp. CONT]|nr:hypothetical protein PENSPDRAFT_734927 [Peniophora sp. CONT]
MRTSSGSDQAMLQNPSSSWFERRRNELGNPETIRWPTLDQITSLNRESLTEVLTLPAIRHLLTIEPRLDEEHLFPLCSEKRIRISRAYERFRPGNVKRLMDVVDEAQRVDVEYGARLVKEALDEVAYEQYNATLFDLHGTGMLFDQLLL